MTPERSAFLMARIGHDIGDYAERLIQRAAENRNSTRDSRTAQKARETDNGE